MKPYTFSGFPPIGGWPEKGKVDLFFSNSFGVSNHRKIEIELCPVGGLYPVGGLEIKPKGIMKRKMKMYWFDSEGVTKPPPAPPNGGEKECAKGECHRKAT